MGMVWLDDFISFKNIICSASQRLRPLNPMSLPKNTGQTVYPHYGSEAVCAFCHYFFNKTLYLTIFAVNLTYVLRRPEPSSIFQLYSLL